jgi:hypothetical protein
MRMIVLSAALLSAWLLSPALEGRADAQMGMGGRMAGRYSFGEDETGLSFTDLDSAPVRSPGPGEGGTLQSRETRVFALFPVYGRGSDTVWSAGLSAEHLSLRFAGFAPALRPALIPDLYGVALNGSVFHRVDGDHAWLGYVAGGRFSDEWPTEGRGRTSAGGVYQVRASPTTTFGVGAGYTYVFGASRFVPILALAYREGPWSANVRLPFRADARYAITDWVRVGAEIFAQGGEFNVADSSAVDTVRYTSQIVGALIAIGRLGGPQLQFDAGWTVYRHYTALENGDTVVSLGFKDAPFYRAGLAWRW